MGPDNPAAAAAKAAEEASRRITIEIWTLYGVALSVTFLRTYARIKSVGFKGLGGDDLFVWIGVVFYTAQTSLGYEIGHAAEGLANNGMTDQQRAALSPDDPEYRLRIIGSKIQVAGWTVYSILIWALKMSVLFFYLRLTKGVRRSHRLRTNIGFALVIAGFIAAILGIYLGCRPFSNYWQIYPPPTTSCQAALSRPIIWSGFAANVSSDLYLILIPLPMLWRSSTKLSKKIAATVVLGAGIFVLVCATLKTIFVLVDPVNGAQLAGSWGIREAFTAVITTNLPMLYKLFQSWRKRLFGDGLPFSQKYYNSKASSSFRMISGSGDHGHRRGHREHPSGLTIGGDLTMNEDEERIIDNVKLPDVKTSISHSTQDHPSSSILVSKQVEIIHDDKQSQKSDQDLRRIHEPW